MRFSRWIRLPDSVLWFWIKSTRRSRKALFYVMNISRNGVQNILCASFRSCDHIILSVVLACWSLLRKALVPLIVICLEGPVAPRWPQTRWIDLSFSLFPRIKYSSIVLNTIVREELLLVLYQCQPYFVKWCFVVPTLVNWKWVAVWELNYFCCPGLYVACISSPILLQYTLKKSIWCSIDGR